MGNARASRAGAVGEERKGRLRTAVTAAAVRERVRLLVRVGALDGDGEELLELVALAGVRNGGREDDGLAGRRGGGGHVVLVGGVVWRGRRVSVKQKERCEERGAVVCQRMSAGTNCGEPSPRGCPPPARHLLMRSSDLPHSKPCASRSNPYAVSARSLSTARSLGSASWCALERARGVARFRGLQLQSLSPETLKISLRTVRFCTAALTNRATSLGRSARRRRLGRLSHCALFSRTSHEDDLL